MLAERDLGLWRYMPNADALSRACSAVYEMLGDPVRVLLAASHLRRNERSQSVWIIAPTALPAVFCHPGCGAFNDNLFRMCW